MLKVNEKKQARTGTFVDNMSLPVHRWFRYSAGFSADWVVSLIKSQNANRVIDPFVGSGTTLLAADAAGVESLGFESHTFVKRIAESKLSWNFDRSRFADLAKQLVQMAVELESDDIQDRTSDRLLGKMYSKDSLSTLERLRLAFTRLHPAPKGNEERILWLGITSILRPCSHAGTAQWQYVLPKKSKNGAKEPIAAFEAFCDRVLEDSFFVELDGWTKRSSILLQDARCDFPDQLGFFDLLVTSPPYPNNYDYADATRLEMTFWKEVTGWGDLQSVVRKDLMRSCSQHSAAEKLNLEDLLLDNLLAPIRKELRPVCERLAEVRLTRGGRKTYHTMIAAYFLDLANVLKRVRKVMAQGSNMCFVIGDSAPYGVHVPAERWIGELAMAVGFTDYAFEKLRERNVKWDNRVHKVPLHEGNLWIQG